MTQPRESMTPEKLQEASTLFFPLYIRARETGAKAPALRDAKAVEILRRLELDTSIFAGSDLPEYAILTRAIIFDKVVKRFITEKSGVVVNLGAGLDTRSSRLDLGKTRWYDVDAPERINLRRRFFKESVSVHFIEKSPLNFTWVQDVVRYPDEPVLFLAEGLLMYYREAEVKGLFQMLSHRFPGSEIYFDTVYSRWVRQGKHPSAYRWGIAKAADFKKGDFHLDLVEHWDIKDFYPQSRQLLCYLTTFLRMNSKKRLLILRARARRE